jgi:hypothetical protein
MTLPILNKFTKATTMDLHSVNYLFSDISLKGLSLKYVRLRDNIKNIQASWFKDAPAFEGAYSYSKEGNGNAYCVYCNSLSRRRQDSRDLQQFEGTVLIIRKRPSFSQSQIMTTSMCLSMARSIAVMSLYSLVQV